MVAQGVRNMIINVKTDFHAKGDGIANDGPAIQAAIDAATGNANPATTNRRPTAAVYLPAGVYKSRASILIRSVQGFHLFGDGPDLTQIRVAEGANLPSLLEIDGAADGIFEGFTLSTADSGGGTDFVDKMLYLHWSGLGGPAARSTSNNNFRDITIIGGHFRTGFAVGSEVADKGNQCDASIFQHCLVSGSLPKNLAPPSQPPHWRDAPLGVLQNGWEIGNGTHANNINHFLYGCSWTFVRFGLRLNASNAMLYGSQPAGAQVDINISGAAHPIVIDGMRSELSGALIDHGGGEADCHVSLRNINWGARGLTDKSPHFPNWIRRACSGSLQLENVVCENPPPNVKPSIELASPGGNPLSCVASSVATNSPVESAFSPGAGTRLTIFNYHERNKNNAIVAITPIRVTEGSKVIFHVPGA
jgi:Pectate lyase superfamily protein